MVSRRATGSGRPGVRRGSKSFMTSSCALYRKASASLPCRCSRCSRPTAGGKRSSTGRKLRRIRVPIRRGSNSPPLRMALRAGASINRGTIRIPAVVAAPNAEPAMGGPARHQWRPTIQRPILPHGGSSHKGTPAAIPRKNQGWGRWLTSLGLQRSRPIPSVRMSAIRRLARNFARERATSCSASVPSERGWWGGGSRSLSAGGWCCSA